MQKYLQWWGRYWGGGNVLIPVGKERLHKVQLTKINILTICFPPLQKTQTILISIFSPKQDKKQVSLQIDLSHSKLSEKRFSLFSDHCDIILSTVKTFKSLAKIEKGWLIKDTGPFFTHAEFKWGPKKEYHICHSLRHKTPSGGIQTSQDRG